MRLPWKHSLLHRQRRHYLEVVRIEDFGCTAVQRNYKGYLLKHEFKPKQTTPQRKT
jgi:hypothetical protein